MTKGGSSVSNYLNIETNTTGIIDPAVNRILWYPLKNAFLTGNILITDVSDVGENSFASGYQSLAKGMYSQALGYKSVASADYSTAMGSQSHADGYFSFAMGNQSAATGNSAAAIGGYCTASAGSAMAMGWLSTASGVASFASGNGCNASAPNSQAMGWGSTASGDGSTAIGNACVASGHNSFALGISCSSSGENSFAFGDNSQAIGSWTYAIGYHNKATWGPSYAFGDGTTSTAWGSTTFGWGTMSMGEHSIAMGSHTISNSLASLVLGQANDTTVNHPGTEYGTSRNYWWSDEPIFIIGNGDVNPSDGTVSSRSNAFIILKDGSTGINMNRPSYMLDVKGRARFISDGKNTAGHWLTTKAGADRAFIGMSSDDYVGFYGSVSLGWGLVMNLDNGNVGVGTITPSAKLEVVNGNGTAVSSLSGDPGYCVSTTIGRTSEEGRLSICASAGQFAPSAAAGDMVLRIDDASKSVHIGAGSGMDELTISSTSIKINGTDINVPNMATGSGTSPTNVVTVIGGKLVNYSITSSIKYKRDVSDMENIDWLYNLRPVNFVYKSDPTGHKEYGLIAEEVEKVNPDFVAYDEKGEIQSVHYQSMIAPLIKAAQDQKLKIEALSDENHQLKSEVQTLREEVSQIKAMLAK